MPEPSMRVLIIEDERRLGDLLCSALPDMGFEATTARSAEEGLHIMEAVPHSIILLDLRLPGMSGLDLFETIHQKWPETAVIILTGYGDFETARRAIRLGVVEFLTKPASLGEVEQALERARSRLSRRPSVSRSLFHQMKTEPVPNPELPSGPPQTLEELERQHILAVLDRNNGNRTAAAAELGISLRTLYYRLAQYERQRHSGNS